MKNKTFFRKADQIGLVLCVVFLGTLTGCVGYGEGPRAGTETTFVVQDDYVYYPSYECYYSVSRHLYAYREGNAWVARPVPRGIPLNVLRASPSVRMDFHDSPAHHHATVVKQYPKNWSPSGAKPPRQENPGRKEDRKDDLRQGR
jgi:hypothetical protein